MVKTIGTHWENERADSPARVNYFLEALTKDIFASAFLSMPDGDRSMILSKVESDTLILANRRSETRRIKRAYNKTRTELEKKVHSGEISWDQFYAIDDAVWAETNKQLEELLDKS